MLFETMPCLEIQARNLAACVKLITDLVMLIVRAKSNIVLTRYFDNHYHQGFDKCPDPFHSVLLQRSQLALIANRDPKVNVRK